jgi:RNA polymerase sigma factor (sigma-70 family)
MRRGGKKGLFGRDPLADPEPLIRRVYLYVSYRLGDGPDAEDVTGTVLENAVRYIETYDEVRGEPLTWLLGIARRCVAQALVGREQATLELHEMRAEGDLEAETIERLTLEAALQTLSEHDRELLSLRYGADLRARQIGKLLGMKPNAVDVAIHRALARLREALEREEAEAQTEITPTTDPAQRLA